MTLACSVNHCENNVENNIQNVNENEIMEKDACYESIKVQQDTTSKKWEIYLTETNSNRIALSGVGSGLKTIIFVLVNLFVLTLDREKNSKYIFLFEELENNLHPDLQRRLFDYLYKYVKDTEDRIVLTSHSNVAIDYLYKNEGNGIYHVQKKQKSELLCVRGFNAKSDIIDDLGHKASDLIQANGIIWVEGPSDRIYINHWLKVLCGSEFKEGIDYQFMYYGGKLLSQYTDEVEGEQVADLINIMHLNRNAIVVMDSDKRASDEKIRDAKIRVKNEVERTENMVWITAGREIENYIPSDAIKKMFGKDKKQIDQYDSFPNYIKSEDPNFLHHKVEFAKRVIEFIDKENSKILDVEEKIKMIYSEIERWNS